MTCLLRHSETTVTPPTALCDLLLCKRFVAKLREQDIGKWLLWNKLCLQAKSEVASPVPAARRLHCLIPCSVCDEISIPNRC